MPNLYAVQKFISTHVLNPHINGQIMSHSRNFVNGILPEAETLCSIMNTTRTVADTKYNSESDNEITIIRSRISKLIRTLFSFQVIHAHSSCANPYLHFSKNYVVYL